MDCYSAFYKVKSTVGEDQDAGEFLGWPTREHGLTKSEKCFGGTNHQDDCQSTDQKGTQRRKRIVNI